MVRDPRGPCRGMGSIPSQGTKIPASQPKIKKKKKGETHISICRKACMISAMKNKTRQHTQKDKGLCYFVTMKDF